MTEPTINPSEAAVEARLRKLAALDWGNVPNSLIFEEFGVSYPTISKWRQADVYKEQIEELRANWHEQVSRLPSGATLRKKIEHGMTLSLDVLIQILAGKAAHKDKISAARLMAQLDGRFLHGTDEDADKPGAGVESLASELLAAVKRQERIN